LLPWAAARLRPRLSSRRLALVGLLPVIFALAAVIDISGSPNFYDFFSPAPLVTYVLAPTLTSALALALVLATPRREAPAPRPSGRLARLVVGWVALAALINLAGGTLLGWLASPLFPRVEDSFRLSQALFAITQLPL